jgi:hypothetical protein
MPVGRRGTAWILAAVLLLVGVSGLSMMRMPGHTSSWPLPPLSEQEVELRERLSKHVWELAGNIGERNIWHPEALAAAADYIETQLRASGYRVAVQEFEAWGQAVRNLEAERTGARVPEEIVLLGAHYDSVTGSPGANDNATGAAALLEIARVLADRTLARTVRFVAFTTEEPPFFQTEIMGSRVYARRARQRGDNIVAMLSLETIGFYADGPGSQMYPFPFVFLSYPRTANFIGFVGNLQSRPLVKESLGSFRQHTGFPSEGVAAPGWLMGIGWSDHWSFWREGYQAVMVTDTALFRYEHYHSSTDTPDKIDYTRMARVTAGLARVAGNLAGSVAE